jgi:[amino group carrier protein]-L-2-aminoadipate 6-kinase
MLYVVKIGGGNGIDPATIVPDIADLIAHGHQVIILHGCSAATEQLSTAMGVAPRYVISANGVRSRRTDAQAMQIFLMAAQRVNADIVRALQNQGINAIGLNGSDGSLLRATRKATLRIVENGRQMVLHDDYTGRVEQVNRALLDMLLTNGYVPVVAPVALAHTGEIVNVDGDRAAALVATSVNADSLVILSNVPGLLADIQDEHSLIPNLTSCDVADWEDRCSGGMRRKLMGVREARSGGVQQVILADGRVAQPIQSALAGNGTVIA